MIFVAPRKEGVTHKDLQAVAPTVEQNFVNPVNAGQKFGHQERTTKIIKSYF